MKTSLGIEVAYDCRMCFFCVERHPLCHCTHDGAVGDGLLGHPRSVIEQPDWCPKLELERELG